MKAKEYIGCNIYDCNRKTTRMKILFSIICEVKKITSWNFRKLLTSQLSFYALTINLYNFLGEKKKKR